MSQSRRSAAKTGQTGRKTRTVTGKNPVTIAAEIRNLSGKRNAVLPKIPKDKSSEKNSKKNRKKNEDQDEKNSQDQKQREQENSRKGIQAAGSVGEGTGIYSGLSWNLTEGKSSAVTIGTTPEAMRGIETGSMKAAGQIADHNCQIIYHAGDGSYTVASHAAENIELWQGGRILKQLQNGERVRVSGQTRLEVGREHFLWLK